ncbi:unnamed protein product, partial [Eretmochelys imbricata]
CPLRDSAGGVRPGSGEAQRDLQTHCAVSGYSISSGYWWPWIRQSPGKALRWMAEMDGDGSISSAQSLKNRLAISVYVSKNESISSITELPDSCRYAVYYCARG